MKAVRLHLRNVLSFEELTLEFGEHITIVRAHNGAGKTNLKSALLSFIEVGNDATLLRAGATEGEAVLVLSDDGQPWTLKEKITAGGIDRHVMRPDGSKDTAFRTFVNTIANAMTANPVRFIQAEPQERARVFLEQMQVHLTAERLAASGITDYPPDLLAKHGLEALKQLDKLLRNKREGIGGMRRKAAETAETLRAGLPAERPDVDRELADARKRLAEKQGELGSRRAAIGDMAATQRRDASAKYKQQRDDIDRQIAALLSQKRELDAIEKAEQSEITTAATQQFSRYQQQMAGDIEALTGEVATLEQQRDARVRAAGTRALIDKHQVDAEDLQQQWDGLTEQIRQLEVIEGELLQNVPIKNVDVQAGELYREGVPFARWNEERQWALAFQIAKMRAGRLGFVCVDGIQFMDPRHKEAFQAAATASGLQFLVTEVNVDCQCGHPHSVHGPKCTVTLCECEGFVDPGMVVERVGEVPALFDMQTTAARPARRRR